MESLICVLHNLPELNELDELSPVQGSSGLARARAWESRLGSLCQAWPRMAKRAPADPPRGKNQTAAVLSTVAKAPAQSTMVETTLETTSTHQQAARSLLPAPPMKGKVVYHPTNAPASATTDSGTINNGDEPPRGLVKDEGRQNHGPQVQVIENMHNARPSNW